MGMIWVYTANVALLLGVVCVLIYWFTRRLQQFFAEQQKPFQQLGQRVQNVRAQNVRLREEIARLNDELRVLHAILAERGVVAEEDFDEARHRLIDFPRVQHATNDEAESPGDETPAGEDPLARLSKTVH